MAEVSGAASPGKDAELQNFLQRAAGYMLTGITREHALLFAFRNRREWQKHIHSIRSAQFSTNMPASRRWNLHGNTHRPNNPQTSQCCRGARLVTAQETEVGRRWDESRIKGLTGGDPITSRFIEAGSL